MYHITWKSRMLKPNPLSSFTSSITETSSSQALVSSPAASSSVTSAKTIINGVKHLPNKILLLYFFFRIYHIPSSVAKGGGGGGRGARAPPLTREVCKIACFFVLLRPIFCEKLKIAPPIGKQPPPQTSEFAKLDEKSVSISVKTFFFLFFLETT